MPLTAGTRLGPYEIVGALGAGGMGEVYKARDTRLQRTVAIKVLPAHVLAEPDARARFEREARAISGLDHPNICVVHDVGREGDVEYIVMQFLDGETLAERLTRGPLPVAEALHFGADVASALARAHRAGFLHRDVKPGNIMIVKAAGQPSAKLLDFGLAKTAVEGRPGGPGVTATSPLTGRGTVVGTLLYMAPEQLEGRDVDARADIFSFGAVLYEMVTGRRAFDAGSQASVIAAILERDPPPMSTLAAITPPALDRVVGKCLQKGPDRRWQSAGDLCDELRWIAQSSGASPTAATPPPGVGLARLSRRILAGAALLLVIALSATLASMWPRRGNEPAPAFRHLTIAMPDGLRLARGGLAISPDGRTVVFAAAADGPGQAALFKAAPATNLYVRRFDSADVTMIRGTANGRAPFFSPDGQSIGYFTASDLWKVSLRGGAPLHVSATPPVTRGGTWLGDGSIVIAPTQTSGLVRYGPEGQGVPLTTPNLPQGEKGQAWPVRLPDGDILCMIRRGTTTDVDASDIAVVNVATGATRVILKGGAFPQYSPTGHLLFVRGGTISAVPFDAASKQVNGTPVPIATDVAVHASSGGAHYAVSPDGVLLFFRGGFPYDRVTPVWADGGGRMTAVAGISNRAPEQPRLSHDGTQVVFSAPSPDGDDEIYVADVERGRSVRVSVDARDDFGAVWTQDSRQVIWTALPGARLPFLVMRAADGTGPTVELLPDSKEAQFAGSVSADRILAFTSANDHGSVDIWTVPLDGNRTARPFVDTPAHEYGPEFSPDGKWIAYVSDESGVRDIYVAPYPGPGARTRVTTSGAVSPGWSRDGRQLYYQAAEGFMAVNVRPGAVLGFDSPRKLFGPVAAVDSREDGPRAWDISPDGRRFLMMKSETVSAPPPVLHVLINWVVSVSGGGQ